MFRLKRLAVFKIKIVYKSGATHEFETYSFEAHRDTYRWESCSDKNKPLLLGVNEIAAIYQTGYRKVWRIVKGD